MMLKYYLFLYLLLFLIQTYAQSTVIAKNGFEDSNSWPIESFSTPPCTLGDDIWNYRESLADIQPSEGQSFWGIQDLNGNCGSSNFEYIDFGEVNLSNWINVNLSFDIQILGFDNGDDLKYQLWLDGNAQPEVIIIDGNSNLSTNGWEKIDISIPNSISKLKLRISVKQNGSDIAGIDNIILEGEAKTYCSEMMISEYIEGSSSLNHRNNYIELYNPSKNEIDLNEHKLVKYTGSSLNYSSELKLNGIVQPYSTYLIEDEKEQLHVEADLSTNSSVMDYNGDDKIALIKNDMIVDLIGKIGDSGNFAKDVTLRRKSFVRSPNNQFDLNEWDSYAADNIKDLHTHASYCRGRLPEIELYGNKRIIPDDNNSSSILDNTYFGIWPITKDTIIKRSFTITNMGNKDLSISEVKIFQDSNDSFYTDIKYPTVIAINDSIEMVISYKPETVGLSSAKVIVVNDDPSESQYSFTIQGEGSTASYQPLMITQYYEGKGNNKWIEITNMSNHRTSENEFYLALYWNEDSYQPIGLKPSRKRLIPSLDPGKSVKFCSTLPTDQPAYAIDGEEIRTSACSFTGDDILIISRSEDEDCWLERIDIVGTQGYWGNDISLVRKQGCKAILPNTGFDTSEWLFLPLDDIDNASEDSNLRLGTHHIAPTIWKNEVWSHGKPDHNRASIIEDNYDTSLHGDLETCHLQILPNSILNVAEGNHISIKDDLIVNGRLEIRNRGSLLMENETASAEGTGTINVYKTATGLKPYDYTYWSSPMENSIIEYVFKDSPENSLFEFSPENFIDRNQDGIDDDEQAWIPVLGAMEAGRGYTSMAPNTNPFKNSQEVIFTGKPHNGTIEVDLGVQSETYEGQHHWNLIGNPYPSAIDAEKLYDHPLNNGLISATFYFWTHHTALEQNPIEENSYYNLDDYAMYTLGTGGIKANSDGETPTGSISSCQGFFVEALKKGVLSFDNSMRTIDNKDVFFKPMRTKKSNKTPKIWLNLTNDSGAFSQILIGFISSASKGYDLEYDGLRLESKNTVSFYSHINGYQLAIQGLPLSEENRNIPLGIHYKSAEKNTLKITLDHFQGDFSNDKILLYDKETTALHDLMLQAYSFELDNASIINDRFELQIRPQTMLIPDSIEVASKIEWNLFNNRLMVKTSNNDLIQRLEIFDLNGRQLRRMHLKNTIAEINWFGFPSRAIYVLRILLEDSRILTSKILP